MFNEYEIVFIMRPDLDEATIKETIERIEASVTDAEGHLLEREDWGQRKLQYLIEKHARGHYVLLRALTDPSAIVEIERRMRLSDRILRFLTVQQATQVDVESRLAQAEERRRLAAEGRAANSVDPEDEDNTHDDDDNDDS